MFAFIYVIQMFAFVYVIQMFAFVCMKKSHLINQVAILL
nr:MAG TPA: hypothetical protein [Caudoviricetes sp.]